MDSLPQSLSFLLNYTTRNMRRYAGEVLSREHAGVTIDQWGVLKILDESGGALTNAELAGRMLKDRPTVTRIVDILVRERLVTRVPDKLDRRRLRLHLTRAGRGKIAAMGPLVQRIRDDLGSGLAESDRQALIRALAGLNDTIDRLRGDLKSVE